ncbi:MAG: DUF3185 domain-containing protein [Acidobacteria bacterium]|nr:DUF3185 domain-containing protein [Acidobacteriota bacterium]
MKIVGILLVVLGIVGLVWGGVRWTTRDTVVDAGPLQITKDEHKALPLSPIASGIILAAGVALIVANGKRVT